MKRRLSQATPSALPVLSTGSGLNSLTATPKTSSPAVMRFKHASSQIPSFLPLSAKTTLVAEKDKPIVDADASTATSIPQAGPDFGMLQASTTPSVIAATRLPRRSSLKHAAKRSLSKTTTLTLTSATPPRKPYTRRDTALPRHNSGTLRSRLPARSSPAPPSRTLQLHLPQPTTPVSALTKPSLVPDRPSKKTRVLQERNANDADADAATGAGGVHSLPDPTALRRPPKFPVPHARGVVGEWLVDLRRRGHLGGRRGLGSGQCGLAPERVELVCRARREQHG
ncbi:hypothetical protein EVG20_g10281 [Dentipellis fragilis]|uniref:Uncharacterized protein n=1 Tax=Dentipellis fragilis TaxID=205917 RepID=A0A4Y9XV90_9AGAM|nr:hypothetical protein EVG20_g10281 [Dentipellis fragilis]